MTTAIEAPKEPPERRLAIDSGKYTFIINKPGDYRVHVLRHGEPWIIVEQGTNAIFSLVYDMIDANALASAVRRWATPGDGYQQHGELHQAFRAYCAERGEERPAKLEDAAAGVSIADLAHVVHGALTPSMHFLESLSAEGVEGQRIRLAAALDGVNRVIAYVDGLVKLAQPEGQ